MPKLLSTPRKDIDVKVVYGQTIFDLYQQIIRLLQKESPDGRLSLFFAEPIPNVMRGEINWHTRASGTIRKLEDLTSEQKQAVAAQLQANCAEVRSIVAKLEKTTSAKDIGVEALKHMLMTPDLGKSLFIVGEHLVLTQWGCFTYGQDSKNFDLNDQVLKSVKLPPPAPPVIAEPEPEPEPKPAPPVLREPESAPIVMPQPVSEKLNAVADQPSSPESVFDAPAMAETPPESPAQVPPAPPIPPEPPENTEPAAQEPEPAYEQPFYWRWLVLLLLLLLLIVGLFLKDWLYTPVYDPTEENAVRDEIRAMWGKIDDKAKMCLAPPATPVTPIAPPPETTPPETPAPTVSEEEVERRLDDRTVRRGGAINVALAWNSTADLDLSVQEPSGSYVCKWSPRECLSTTGGSADIDANLCGQMAGCRRAVRNPVENISWAASPPAGRYKVFVRLFSSNATPDALEPVPYTVVITKDGKKTSYTGIIKLSDIKCGNVCQSNNQLVTEIVIQ